MGFVAVANLTTTKKLLNFHLRDKVVSDFSFGA